MRGVVVRRLETYRVQLPEKPEHRLNIICTATIANLAREIFRREADCDKECFLVLSLNIRRQITGYKIISMGTLNHCLAYPREVFRSALTLNAAAIIVAHNHPGGSLEASKEDKGLTRRLKASGKLLGIPLEEHLIITVGGHALVEVEEPLADLLSVPKKASIPKPPHGTRPK